MTAAKPALRPTVPHFSSGPCAKRPGWNPQNLKDAALGRSHRAKVGKTKLKLAIELTREVLEVPADYKIGIVPASDMSLTSQVIDASTSVDGTGCCSSSSAASLIHFAAMRRLETFKMLVSPACTTYSLPIRTIEYLFI